MKILVLLISMLCASTNVFANSDQYRKASGKFAVASLESCRKSTDQPEECRKVQVTDFNYDYRWHMEEFRIVRTLTASFELPPPLDPAPGPTSTTRHLRFPEALYRNCPGGSSSKYDRGPSVGYTERQGGTDYYYSYFTVWTDGGGHGEELSVNVSQDEKTVSMYAMVSCANSKKNGWYETFKISAQNP